MFVNFLNLSKRWKMVFNELTLLIYKDNHLAHNCDLGEG